MHKKSKHHDKLLTVAAIIGVIAVIFVLWQWTQLPHEAFPVDGTLNNTNHKEVIKKQRPALPVTNNQ